MKGIAMKKNNNRFISILTIISIVLSCFMFPLSAIDMDSNAVLHSGAVYDIEVGGVNYHVTVTPNADGSLAVVVEGGGSTVYMTTNRIVEEPVSVDYNVISHSYGGYRYTFCETAAVPWHLYRPLPADGSAATKGIGYIDSEFAERYADEIKTAVQADALIDEFTANKGAAGTIGAQVLLGAVGGYLGFFVPPSRIAATIAGAVSTLIFSFAIPAVWEAALTELVDIQYYVIREALMAAENYFELA